MRKPRIIGYDSKCYDLAEHFLDDIDKSQYENDITEQLAMIIQQNIETWLNYDLEYHRKKENDDG